MSEINVSETKIIVSKLIAKHSQFIISCQVCDGTEIIRHNDIWRKELIEEIINNDKLLSEWRRTYFDGGLKIVPIFVGKPENKYGDRNVWIMSISLDPRK